VPGSHPGFDALARKIGKRTNPRTGQPYGEERARAILASAARGASAKAKRTPSLRHVPGA